MTQHRRHRRLLLTPAPIAPPLVAPLSAPLAAPLVAIFLALLALPLQGCEVAGPAAIGNGRSVYNAVINRTEDEQVLSMIVNRRYDETFGMLAVASVTANIRLGANVGGNAGFGSSSSFEGNLVPLSAGAAYEESPTISYVPMRGEQFVERMLAPVSAEQVLLLSRMSGDAVEALRFLVRRANGIVNPVFASSATAPENVASFDRFVNLYAQLREGGRLDVVQVVGAEAGGAGAGVGAEAGGDANGAAKGDDGGFMLLLHDYADGSMNEVGELLRLLGVGARADGSPIMLPLRFLVGAPRRDGVDLETPSAMEVVEAAAMGVEVPEDDLTERRARPNAAMERHRLITIRSSRDRPADASVAVAHGGWWFYVDARDVASKQAFMFLRTLIGMRLDQAGTSQQVPVLTVPVGR